MTDLENNPDLAPGSSDATAAPLLEALLGVHSAPSMRWLADAAGTAAERGLGALYCLLYLSDAQGNLAGQRPASSERMRALVKVQQALGTDLTSLKFDPHLRTAIVAVLQEGHARSLPWLEQAIPLPQTREQLIAIQRQLGVGEAWLAPVEWGGERLGLLVLLMPAKPTVPLVYAELLGRHLAVALADLREKEQSRKQGELDAVRWVFDERRYREELAQEMRRAERHKRPLSILLLRLCNLAELRTRYGRFLAEQVLRQLAAQVAATVRDTDFLAAHGEDGFAAILVEADQKGATRARERLLSALQDAKLPQADLPDLDLQLACATATQPDDGETAEDLLASAERRLGEEGRAEEAA